MGSWCLRVFFGLMLAVAALGVLGCQHREALVQLPVEVLKRNKEMTLVYHGGPPTVEATYPEKLGPQEILLRGMVLGMPQDVLGTSGPDFRAQLESGKMVSRDVIDRFLTDTRTRLILRPRMKSLDDQHSGFYLSTEAGIAGGVWLDFITQRREDGAVKLYSMIKVASTGRHPTMDCVSDERVVRPAARGLLSASRV